jgi:hypothetical protein
VQRHRQRLVVDARTCVAEFVAMFLAAVLLIAVLVTTVLRSTVFPTRVLVSAVFAVAILLSAGVSTDVQRARVAQHPFETSDGPPAREVELSGIEDEVERGGPAGRERHQSSGRVVIGPAGEELG